MAVSLVVFYKGDYIAKKTTGLIAQEVPTYDLLRKLNNNLIEQELFLYEFYATEQQTALKKGYGQTHDQSLMIISQLLSRFGDIPPLQLTQESMQKLDQLATEFVENIMLAETNWTKARQQLSQISDVRRATSPLIQQLIVLTEGQIDQSENVILNGLELVRMFVVLYGIATLLIAYVVAKALRAYLATTATNQRLSLFSTRNPNPVISLDENNRVTYCNPATEKLLLRLGLPKGKTEALLAKNISEYQNKVLTNNELDSVEFEYPVEQSYFLCELHWLADQKQWDMHLTEVTERKKAEQELQYRASHHPLTGLLNRYELEKEAARLCATNTAFAFGHIEIRSYSQLIAGQGVDVAAQVVKEIAVALSNILFEVDKTGCSLFHLGEKSFAIISTSCLDKEKIGQLVANIEKRIRESIFHSQYQVQLDFGFSVAPEHGKDYTQLHKSALAALDKSASSDDKHHVLFNHALGEKIEYQQQLTEDLKLAIEKQQFELYFQPQLSLATGKMVGAEALIRWQRNGQWIGPSEFIPLTESAGLIDKLGSWILRTACEKAQNLVANGHTDIVVAVNISPIQFSRKNFLQQVTDVLAQTQLPAQNLELEITEGVIIYNEQEAIETLTQLKQLGVHLSIDDFGTGYSSLSYLRRFNIDKLKIDLSFIEHIQKQQADQSIVRTIIELAHNLELKVIAEGVENAGQQQILKDLGCDEIQGFYYSKPLPEKHFREFLKAN
ncbi:EAL domain-containing protein [Paraglaciecola aestuariivivens]